MADRCLAPAAPIEPRYLSRREAAAYLGVSPTTFDEEVSAGLWPPPRRRGAKGTSITWDRRLLDAFADRDSYGQVPLAQAPAVPQVTALPEQVILGTAEAAAMRGLQNAAPRHRPKHRQQKAA
jgi:predicted DNA-binding transcriptional regulator AlpA